MAASVKTPVPLIIDGAPATGSYSFPVTNPSNGDELWEAWGATSTEADAAAAAAAKAFPTWANVNYVERRNLLNKAADCLVERLAELKKYVMEETGATSDWANFDCNTAVGILREVASRVSTIAGTVPQTLDTGLTALVCQVPYGVVLGISPWNAASILGIRSIAYALAAGNTVILKASELCPRAHHLLGDCFREARFPPGVVNVIAHSPEKGPEVIGALIKHPAVKKINFTGSTQVGRILAQLAAKELKPILLELGGKAPTIILEDADVENAAMGVAKGSNLHAGQVCMATERVIVLESVASKFEAVLKETYAKLYADGYLPQAAAQPSGAQKVKDLVDDALSNGAEVVAGKPGFHGSEKRAVPPVVVKGVEKSRIYYEESFGPAISMIVVPTVDEAVRVANDTEYGLSAGVWGSLSKALAVAKRIDSGAVHINDSTIHDEPTLPHGGMKSSGHGRFGGSWGIAEFLTTKTITFKI
ncbi:Aldehyde/histidinol dehydrogenase [Exophiala viscosa]|uniref:Aldehyde/histidinol dehydrogenase n=1 Tax=Exophiala viscosa TaxID=2486360 RepID=UPI00219A5BE2|nr:Aldehyde/histidinol dehydrogenase [Exophiala viscosa]